LNSAQQGNGPLGHYDYLGYTCCAAMLACWWLVGRVDRQAKLKPDAPPVVAAAA
jgi:hypothetical protein